MPSLGAGVIPLWPAGRVLAAFVCTGSEHGAHAGLIGYA